MSRKSLIFGFAAGLLSGLLIAVTFFNARTMPRSSAQNAAPVEPLRFQLSAWAYPATNGFGPASHGAYLLDTKTGKIWSIERNQKTMVAD